MLRNEELKLRLEQVVATEKRKLQMMSFRFSTDANSHFKEANQQIKVLYPFHSERELMPLCLKFAAKDFGQARRILINPTKLFYPNNKSDYQMTNNNSSAQGQKKFNNYKKSRSPTRNKEKNWLHLLPVKKISIERNQRLARSYPK
eukprot:GHVP01047364.1.p1 GENE.GHVP01047364.1~~GHVP01047364.1.p1  ORF type:complete len:146 (+),score=23.89 GHVP01047364.1:1258-1695(+)